MKTTISSALQDVNFENKHLLWEYLKCQIRSDTILYAGQKAKQRKQKEIELLEKIENLEKNLDNSESKFIEYQTVKSEYENIQDLKANGAIIRSKAKWIEYGEKNSKYFLNLEKRNYRAKYIKKVMMTNGII